MTQSELSNLIMQQCSRYGEPSTLRALVPFLLTAAPEAVPFVEAAAEARDEFYRANGIRPGGGKTERDAVSRCRCAAQMSKSPDVGKATKKRKSCPLCIPGIK
jgi:hypothetical protein